MNNNEYIKRSLELHLFFDRIMKEHSFFLAAGFLDKDMELRKIAESFMNAFTNILDKVIVLADGNISRDFIESSIMMTKDTMAAEKMTSMLSGVNINTVITSREGQLKAGNIIVSDQLVSRISFINKQTLPLIKNLIQFKNDVLNKMLNCKIYTFNYPLLISHIMNEAKMYYSLLERIENRTNFSDKYIYEQEMFWNNIMKEHAEFIRGLLDPSEKDLINTANKYALEYEEILNNKNNFTSLLNNSLSKTIDFRNFKIASEEGILNCKIKSIIIPLLADHVLREANHFISILKNVNSFY